MIRISYKKCISILGLFVAIIVSLFVGTIFDSSILEGLEENPSSTEKSIYEEENPDLFDKSKLEKKTHSSDKFLFHEENP